MTDKTIRERVPELKSFDEATLDDTGMSPDEVCRLAKVKREVFLDSMANSEQPWFSRTRLGRHVVQLQVALEQHLESMHETIVKPVEDLGWYGVALYHESPSGTSLEAIAATDASVPGVIKHSLPRADSSPAEREACDIEAHTFLEKQAEHLGKGYDRRYNWYVYKTLGHERFVDRLFVPLVLVRDFSSFSLRQEACTWHRDGNFWKPIAPSMQLQAIGTLSVSSLEPISPEVYERTLDFATRVAAPLAHRVSLQGLCEAVITEIARVAGADSATLHLLHGADVPTPDPSSCLVLRAGQGISRLSPAAGALGAQPRPNGIGAEALRLQLPVRFEGADLEERNPTLARDGILATDAYPLVSAEGRTVGLVYLHYRTRKPTASLEEVFDVVMFAAHVVDVALRFKQRSYWREHVLSEAMHLVGGGWPAVKNRSWAMAHFAWNLLGCDHVTIVAMIALNDGQADEGIGHAGRCRNSSGPTLDSLIGVLERFGRGTEPIFVHWENTAKPRGEATGTKENASGVTGSPHRPGDKAPDIFSREGFAEREGFQTTAVLPMVPPTEGTESQGLLIVDYRTHHEFDATEKELLHELSQLFALGVTLEDGQFVAHERLRRLAGRLQRERIDAAGDVCRVVYSPQRG